MPGNVANPNLEKINLEEANTRKKNNEISFNQGILAVIKRRVEQLVLDMSLRDQIIKEANAALESQRIQSIKDSAEELFLAMLEKIEQKLKENLDGQLSTALSTTLNQKLENLSKQVQNIFTLKATFAVEQQAIDNDVVAIRTEVADIEVALNAPDIATADLDILETRAVDLEQKVHSVGRVIDGWLQKFDEVSASTEKSLQEVRNSILEAPKASNKEAALIESAQLGLSDQKAAGKSKEVDFSGLADLMSLMHSILPAHTKANSKEFLKVSNIYFSTEKNILVEYKKELLHTSGVSIPAIKSAICRIRSTNMYEPQPASSFNMHAFLRTPSSGDRRNEKDQDRHILIKAM